MALEFRYDTQLLIDGHDLDEDEINDYITEHFKGDCLLAVGDGWNYFDITFEDELPSGDYIIEVKTDGKNKFTKDLPFTIE